MLDMAFSMIKFLSDFRPRSGLSFTFGTASLLNEQSYANFFTSYCGSYLVAMCSFPSFLFAFSESLRGISLCFPSTCQTSELPRLVCEGSVQNGMILRC